MKLNPRLVLFLLLCVAQLGVPFTMIRQHEVVLLKGTQVKLKCQPVDPADFFRGRYVSLAFDMGEAKMQAGEKIPEEPTPGVVTFAVGADGFAQWGIATTQDTPSDAAAPYLRTKISKNWSTEGDGVWVEPQLDRFYLPEDLAPEAERLYFEGLRETPETTYVTARVLDGVMVLEQLYLNDTPVVEFVRQQLALPLPEPTFAPMAIEGEADGVVEVEPTSEGVSEGDSASEGQVSL